MICKNQHCQAHFFIAVLEENQRLIGVKCGSCGARYSLNELEIKTGVTREGRWNSVTWSAI